MGTKQLRIRFDPPEGVEGIPLEDVEATLGHLRKAVRELVWHFGSGDSAAKGRRPPRWAVEQSALKMFRASPGSLVIDLGLPERPEELASEPDYGGLAVEAILGWKGPGDSAIPEAAARHLARIEKGLSEGVAQARLTDWSDRGDVVLRSRKREARSRERDSRGEFEPARADGLLLEVNWRKRTAQLHPSRLFPSEPYVALRFEKDLDDVMLRYATQFVTVAGRARFTPDDEYDVFHVEEVIPSRGNKPSTKEEREESLARTPPYDSKRAVTASVPFDVDEFIRVIHEARDAETRDEL